MAEVSLLNLALVSTGLPVGAVWACGMPSTLVLPTMVGMPNVPKASPSAKSLVPRVVLL